LSILGIIPYIKLSLKGNRMSSAKPLSLNGAIPLEEILKPDFQFPEGATPINHYSALGDVTTHEEAEAYARKLIASFQRHGKMDERKAAAIVFDDIGFMAGQFDPETAQRIQQLFATDTIGFMPTGSGFRDKAIESKQTKRDKGRAS
jgi:hypothetical protein